jgi:tape measure domain-containing protein
MATENITYKITAKDMASGTFKAVGASLRMMGNATTAPVKGMGALVGGMGRMTGGAKGAIGSLFSLKGAIYSLGTKLVASKIIGYADAWTTTANKLKLVSAEGEVVINTQEKLFKLAQESRGPLGSVSALYSRIARSTEELGLEQQELLDVTETISKAFTVSGAGAQEMDAAILQLGQGLASGVLRGEELNSVMEQAPRLARAIADGMEIPFGQLRKMASEGKVTSAVLIKALQSQGDAIRQEFEQIEPTVGSLMTNIDNAFQRMVGLFNEQVGFTQPIKDAMMFLVDMFSVTIPAAMMMIPQMIAFMAKSFGLLKDIAMSVWKQITDDPIGMLERLFTFMVNNFANGIGFMIKAGALLWEQYIDTSVATLEFLKTLIIDNFTFAWETVKAGFFRFVVNPVIGGFKIILTNVAEAIDRFAPETAGKLREALENITEVGDVDFPKVPDDVRESFDALIASMGNVDERLGALGQAYLDAVYAQAGDVATLLGLTEEQLAAINGLGVDLDSMWDDARKKMIEANEAAKETGTETAAAEAVIAEKAPLMVRAWEAVKDAINKLSTEGLKGAKAGVAEYEKSLGSIASNVQAAVNNSLRTLEGGVSSGFDSLLFGGDKGKAAKKVAKDLKPIAQQIRDSFNSNLSENDRTRATGGLAAMIDTALEGRDVSGSLRRRAEEIRNSISFIGENGLTADGVAKDIEGLVKQLESEGNLMDRIGDFGIAIKESLVSGFQTSTVKLFTVATMSGFLQFGEGVLGALTGKGEDIAEDTKAGMVTKWGASSFSFIHEVLGTAVGTFTETLKGVGNTIFGDMHDGGEATWLGKTFMFLYTKLTSVVSGFAEIFKSRGNDISDSIESGADDRWGEKSFDFLKSGVDGKVKGFSTDFRLVGSGVSEEIGSGMSLNWGEESFDFLKSGVDGKVKGFSTDFRLVGSGVSEEIGSGMSLNWGEESFDFLKSGVDGKVKGFSTDFRLVGSGVSEEIGSGMSLNWGEKDFNFIDQDVAASIGARRSEYDASGKKIGEYTGGGLRQEFRDTDYTSDLSLEIDKDTEYNAEALKGSGMNIGERLGKGLGQALSTYILGTAFTAVLSQITGIDVPEPIVRGVAIAEGVAGLFGTSLTGKLKDSLFGTTAADGGLLGSMFGAGGVGIGGAMALAAAAAFTEIFIPSARQALQDFASGDVLSGTKKMLDTADEMFAVIGDITGGILDIDLSLGSIFSERGRSAELKEFQKLQYQLKRVRSEEGFTTDDFFEKALTSGSVGLLSLSATSGNIGNVQALSERVEVAFGNEIATIFSELIKSLAAKDKDKSDKLAGSLGAIIKAQGGAEKVAQSLGVGYSKFTGQKFNDPYPEPVDDGPEPPTGPVVSTSKSQARDRTDRGNELGLADASQYLNDVFGGGLGEYADLQLSRRMLSDFGSERINLLFHPDDGYSLSFLSRVQRFTGASGSTVGGIIRGIKDLAAGGTPDMEPFQKAGVSVVARHGAIVPGPPSRGVGAIVHGGERILSVAEQKQMGGMSINITFQMNGNSDAEFERKLQRAVPMIQKTIEHGIQQKSRFGQFSLDSRAVRTVLTN